jgi:hypothetical protein
MGATGLTQACHVVLCGASVTRNTEYVVGSYELERVLRVGYKVYFKF